MKKLNTLLKVCIVVLVTLMIVSGCKKTELAYSPEKEASQMKGWLDAMVANKFNIDTTSTGLFYIVDKVGAGRNVQAGDTVTVQYTGMFLDGGVFDSSTSFTYIHKAASQRMIQGWEEGIETMNLGKSAVFLIPSDKAYGNQGYSLIPPYTPLLFVIEILKIK